MDSHTHSARALPQLRLRKIMPCGGVLLALLLALALARAAAVDVVPLASLEVQVPKAGPFSLTDLSWVYTAVKGVAAMLTAYIPARRLADLRAGEGVRAGTNTLPVESGKLAEGKMLRIVCQRATVKRSVQGMKKRKRAAGDAASADDKKKRGAGLVHGKEKLPLKIGCPVAFTAHLQGEKVLLRAKCLEHNHGNGTAPKYHPKWIKVSSTPNMRALQAMCKRRRSSSRSWPRRGSGSRTNKALLTGMTCLMPTTQAALRRIGR